MVPRNLSGTLLHPYQLRVQGVRGILSGLMRVVLHHFLLLRVVRMCCMLKRSPGLTLRPCAASQCTTLSVRDAEMSRWLLPLAETWLLHASLAPVEQTLRL